MITMSCAAGCIETIDANPDGLSEHTNELISMNLTCQETHADASIAFVIPVQTPCPVEIDGVIFTTYLDGTEIYRSSYYTVSTAEGINVATQDTEWIDPQGNPQTVTGHIRKTIQGDLYLVKI